MKYVILDYHVPIVFPETLCHSSFKNIEGKTATSAGFCNLKEGKIWIGGNSTSLILTPMAADSFLLALLFTGAYHSLIELCKTDFNQAKMIFDSIPNHIKY